MSFTVIIPARFAATRFPGKLLEDLAGKPVIQHVYERASESDADDVVIATDDQRIQQACEGFGARVVMTADSHRSGTDRLQEAAAILGLGEEHCVVNVQGDEPLLPAELINQVAVNLLKRTEFSMATLCEVIGEQSEIVDPNSVKVLFDVRGRAMYFSRATIPAGASAAEGNCYRHLGIYAYRVALLNRFVNWEPAAIEKTERLEQLRALYQGVSIHVEVASTRLPPGIDTPEDLDAVRRHLAGS